MLIDATVHRNALSDDTIKAYTMTGLVPTGDTMDCYYDDGIPLMNRIIYKGYNILWFGVLDRGNNYFVSDGDEFYRVEKGMDLEITPIEPLK